MAANKRNETVAKKKSEIVSESSGKEGARVAGLSRAAPKASKVVAE